MYIVIGLGNPSSKYENTRHNIGYKVIDKLVIDNWVKLKVGKGAYFYAIIENSPSKLEPFLIAKPLTYIKPLTYMNLSGSAAKNLLSDFNETPNFLIVIHDDLDLDTFELRIKKDSSSDGHKSIESIISHLNNSDFLRVKIGIGRPSQKDNVVDYVLTPFSNGEVKVLADVI